MLNAMQINTIGNTANIRFEKERDSADVITKTIALPGNSAELQINNVNVITYNKNGDIISTNSSVDENRVKIIDSFTMRELHAFTVRIIVSQNEGENKSVINDLSFSLNATSTIEIPNKISSAFSEAYEDMADNYSTSYLADIAYKQPSMLIITHQSLESAFANYIKWKKQEGIAVTSVNIEDIGNGDPNNVELKEYIQNLWDGGQHFDYLLLVGDVDNNDPYRIPAFYIQGSNEQDVTDLPYSMLEGDDYQPELLVGRFSIDSSMDLRVITNKIIKYEKTPNVNDVLNPDWMNDALVAAGNWSDTGSHPVTPVNMSHWLSDYLLDNNYAQVDTVFHYGQVGEDPGTNAIANVLNNGVGLVSYRGWGDANGWHFPHFHYDNLLQMVSNTNKTPVVFSIVCNTGDFANGNNCFGEVWMRMGTAGNAKGAVAFVGPSDLHTHTALNNSISSGIFHSIITNGVRSFGSSVLAGKVNLYKNFPNDLEGENSEVKFYYHVYNLLSDPSLKMWIHSPLEMNNTITQGSNYVAVDSDQDNAVVSLTFNDEVIAVGKTIGGSCVLPFDPQDSGEITITVTKANHIPTVQTLSITPSNGVSVINNPFENVEVIAGTTAELSLELKNFSTADVNDEILTMSSSSDFITFDNNEINVGNIPAGQVVTKTASFNVNPDCPQNEVIEIRLESSQTNEVSKIVGMVNGLLISTFDVQTDNSDGLVHIGATNHLMISVRNISQFDITGLNAVVIPLTNSASIDLPNVSFGDIVANSTATANVDLNVDASAANGRAITLKLNFADSVGRNFTNYYYLTAGQISQTDPVGPDNYGYFAYDNGDTSYSTAPTYNWIELNPDINQASNATTIEMFDDDTELIDLPFNFKYYGENYSQISICSNGWISFSSTWMTNFRNWSIPSPLGPKSLIAPYWDDLKGLPNGDSIEPMHVFYSYDEANSKFIIEWDNAYNNFNDTSLEKFEVVLYNPNVYNTPTDDGEILFQYNTIDNPASSNNYATIGIENKNHTDGICYTYANNYAPGSKILQNNLAILFTTSTPDSFTGNDDNVNDITLLKSYNYPNPFNTLNNEKGFATKIYFSNPVRQNVNIAIYNIKGEKVVSLLNKIVNKGKNFVEWDGRDKNNNLTSSGVYFYQIKTKNSILTHKMLLLK